MDITKCSLESIKDCPHAKECWRYQAPASQVQSYACFTAVCNQSTGYPYWIYVEEE